jgi:hypothetical protein
MAACLAMLWPALRPYQWINGDAGLYALQSLARAHPARFAHDLFFQFGSQDQFTLLTTAVSPIFDWLGVDHASTLLTLLAMSAWAVSCFMLARITSGSPLAWLAVALVLAEPGWYGGGGQVFRYGESFFVARLPAEALLLAALALKLNGRTLWGGAALTLASLIHPLMTAPAAAVFLLLALPHLRWRTAVTAAGVAVGAVLLISALAPFGRITIVDPAWLDMIHRRSGFLFPSAWRQDDWIRVAVVVGTLLVAMRLLADTAAGRLARATLMVTVLGLAASFVAGDVFPVALVVQSQPWRALWLATLLATMLLPLAFATAWRSNHLHRAAVLMLVAGWVDLESAVAMPLVLVAALSAWYPREPAPRISRLLYGGSCVALAIVVTLNCLAAVDAVTKPTLGPEADHALELLRSAARFTAPVMLFAGAVWFACIKHPTASGVSLVAVSALVMGFRVLPPAAREFQVQTYSGPSYGAFASWRSRIPQDASVLWLENPFAVWFLLERTNFVSNHQLSGVAFSRDLSLEGARRAAMIRPIADPATLFEKSATGGRQTKVLSLRALSEVCKESSLGFVVSADALANATAVAYWPDRSRAIFLYDCQSSRSHRLDNG